MQDGLAIHEAKLCQRLPRHPRTLADADHENPAFPAPVDTQQRHESLL
jgi:hypothetical protein